MMGGREKVSTYWTVIVIEENRGSTAIPHFGQEPASIILAGNYYIHIGKRIRSEGSTLASRLSEIPIPITRFCDI